MSADLVIVAARTSPGKGAKGITLFAVEDDREGFARDQARQGRPTRGRYRGAVLHRRPGAGRQPHRRGRPGFIAMMERLPRERTSAAVTNVANATQILKRRSSTPRSARPSASRSDRSSTTSSPWPSWSPRPRSPRPTSTSASSPSAPDVDRCRCRQGQVVVGRGAERRPRRLRPVLRRTPTCASTGWPRPGGTPGSPNLGRFQRDHEGAHRPRPRLIATYSAV